MWIGFSRDSTATPLGLAWRGVLKPLGLFSLIIHLFNYKQTSMTNWKNIQTQTRLWSCRGLSLFGKFTIIKSFLLPKMLYIFSVPPTPEAFIKQLNTIIYNFLLKGPDKVARPAGINDLKYGGLNLMDLETSIKSLRLASLGRLFVERPSPWQAFINHLLKDRGGIFLFRCNYDLNEYNINSIFYKELLQWWAVEESAFSCTPRWHSKLNIRSVITRKE